MAEGKKRLYKRETARKALESFIGQAEQVVSGKTDFPDQLIHAIVFGSYVNTDNPKVHDLDIEIVVDEHRELWKPYARTHPEELTEDWFQNLILPNLMLRKFLKKGKSIISLHYVDYREYEEDFMKEVVLGDRHMYIVRDGKICWEVVEGVCLTA